MPGRTAAPIHITPTQEGILRKIARRHSGEQRQVRRSKLLLDMTSGRTIAATARRHGVTRETASIWRQRWLEAEPRLAAVEAEGDDKALREAIEQLLEDEERAGAPCTFTPEQVAQILAVACEDPQACGYPISHWTPTALAKEVVQRKIVVSISPASVGRFLKGGSGAAASVSVLAECGTGGPRGVCGRGQDRV
jgi:putative transposase